MSSVFVFDPTSKDELSKVRGVGRYLQILRENFADDFTFGDEISQVSEKSTFVNPFFNLLAPPLVSKRIAQKQIAVIHDLIPLKYPSHFPKGLKGSLYVYQNRLAMKNYDVVITDSQQSKKDIQSMLNIPSEKVRVVYPCLPKVFETGSGKLEAGKRSEKKDKKNPSSNFKSQASNLQFPTSFCLYVGDATWNKNLVNLAKALKITKVPCVFVGKVFKNTFSLTHPWQQELKTFINEVGNDSNFVFPGYVPDEQLIEYYKKAKVNLLLSKDEGFGFSYLEASNFGLPSILSDIEVLKEIAGEAALFADPNDPQNISEKIKQLYEDEDLRKSISQEARDRIKLFSPQNFKKDFLAALKF